MKLRFVSVCALLALCCTALVFAGQKKNKVQRTGGLEENKVQSTAGLVVNGETQATSTTRAPVGAIEVRVFDSLGALVTNTSLKAIDENGDMVKYMPRPDGVFEVTATVGEKLDFEIGLQTLGQKHPKFTAIVPVTENIDLTMRGPDISNDECGDATTVAVPSVTAGSTVGATADNAGTCGTSNTAPGVWYTVIGTGNTMTASTCELDSPGGANYDTKISVFCLDCDEPTCVGGNDDSSGCNFHSTFSWCSQPGATYSILVHGFSTSTGDFDLSVSDVAGACTPTVDCFPPTPTGACCSCLNPPFDCTITDVDSCLALGGVPRGTDTQCFVEVGESNDHVASPDLFVTVGSPVTHTITVADSFTIGDVDIDLGITHTWIGDLDIVVTHNGVSQSIWERQCGSADDIQATADDEGTVTLCSAINAGPIDAVHYPTEAAGLGPLSVFDGMDAAGDWTITVTDNVGGDDGTLDQWSLHIVEGNPICELNVSVCHDPDGNSPFTIVVGQSSVEHHLNHGDTVGPCEGGSGANGGSFGKNN